jgi:hypothetical protein
MNDKINLIPNSKHLDKNHSNNEKVNKEVFPMRIPDEEDESNNTEENNKLNFEQNDEIKEEKNQELNDTAQNNKAIIEKEGQAEPKKDAIEAEKNQSGGEKNKKTFLDKLKGIFLGK